MKYLKYIGAAIVALLTLIGFLKKRQIDKALEEKHEADKAVANLEGQISGHQDQLSAEQEKQKALKEQLEKDKNDALDKDDILRGINKRDN